MGEANGTSTGIVFLSGGSALQSLAQHLAVRGQLATHVISVFDTGGSAGRLRSVCDGIAIGDLRKRLTAIGNRTAAPTRAVVDLFAARLPADEPPRAVRRRVEDAAAGRGELLGGLDDGASSEIAEAFATLLDTLPDGFDWCDGSVGNMILSGRYARQRDWAAALGWAHRRLAACGSVVPVSTRGAHLGARLRNGREVLGQADITSEAKPIEAPIDDIFLCDDAGEPARVQPDAAAMQQIQAASAIVYAWGSFYTSVLPSLLVEGVGDAIRARPVPKVALLNPVHDSETQGKSAADVVREIRRYAGCTMGDGAVTHVIALRLPNGDGFYRQSDRAELEALGTDVIELESANRPGPAQLERVAEELLRLRQASS